jgi:formylglycine-generating enzyme required for sulfatase activity
MKQILLALALIAMLASIGNIYAVEMVRVEGGTFMMGSEDGDDDESPVHEVTLSSFMIGKYEVTVGEFRAFVEDTNYTTLAETKGGAVVWTGDAWELKEDASWKNPYLTQTEKHPVTCITWYDAIEYCNWLSKQEGLTPVYTINKSKADPKNNNEYDAYKWSVSCNWTANGYRLPTEAEWEFAARGGNKSKGYQYSGSDDLNAVAWYWANAGETTHAVGTKSPNELGIYDMSGNVWEWCWDWYGDYPESRSTDPKGVNEGWGRVLRGGSWGCSDDLCRVANRGYLVPDRGGSSFGLRLVRATN